MLFKELRKWRAIYQQKGKRPKAKGVGSETHKTTLALSQLGVGCPLTPDRAGKAKAPSPENLIHLRAKPDNLSHITLLNQDICVVFIINAP